MHSPAPPASPARSEPRPDLAATPVQDADGRANSRRLSVSNAHPPGHVPGYEIERLLGEGSFGSVWLARELKTGKQVAIKFYTRRRGLDWALLSREVEKLAVLYTSRNVVGLLDVGWDHDPPYFVMEYLESGSLEDRLQAGPLPVDEAVRCGKSIARALVHAHGSGILHCDLKPANVLLDANGEPRIGDFGQSRLTTEQSPSLGTMFYMAPEQATIDSVPDARWDVYALGAVLHHMLTGAPPYRTPETERLLRQAATLTERLRVYREIVQQSPPAEAHRTVPGVDAQLAKIIDGCLARHPLDRCSNPQVVLDRLEEREQSRAKRPLIALGFLGPILFLVAMYWIAEAAVPRIVAAAEQNLIERALGSDVVSARILATSVQQEFSGRQEALERLADAPQVADLIAASKGLSSKELFDLSSGRAPPDTPAAKLYSWMNDQAQEAQERLAGEDRTLDDSWFVTDEQGRQIFRFPPREPGRETTLGRPFHWRDYHHNLGRELDLSIPVDSVKIRTEPSVTSPFRSQATDQYMVAIAVPVWDEGHEKVLGVLARTIHLPVLLKQWEVGLANGAAGSRERTRDELSRFLVLVDARGGSASLLDHPWMTHPNLAPYTKGELDSPDSPLRIPEDEAETLKTKRRTEFYHDPIAELDPRFEGEWLAAAAPVGDTGWLAVVQERREMTVRPVDELRQVFVRAGFWSLAIFSGLLILMWHLIQRAAT
jgi:hypothetical protein